MLRSVIVRRAGMYIVALCVGSTAVRVFKTIVDQFVGLTTGAASILFILASLVLFWVTTAWVFAILAAPKARRPRTGAAR
jgi:hypothetical protein